MVSAVSGSTAALQGVINRDQLDLNDWVTCVSAKTPKGKAEIQKLSGAIGSAKEQIVRIEATQTSTSTNAAASARTASPSNSHEVANRGGLIDVWV